jgi:DNA polymerase-3 subunit beta
MLDGVTGDLELVFDKNQLQVNAPQLRLISRVIDASFPDYKQIIPKVVQTEAVILKNDLVKAVRSAQVFTDNFNQVRFSFKNKENSLSLSAKNNDVGDYSESIQAKITGDDLELSFNYKYVLDSLQSIDAESLHLSLAGAGKPMIISGSGDKSFTYIAMPMNR